MVKAKTAYLSAVQILTDANIEDAKQNARLLFECVTNKDHRLLTQDDEISNAESERLTELCQRRATHEPLQYILGKWQFMNLELKVGKGVLIPRADSECVCMAAIEKLKNREQPVVYDLCAGSGALGLAIKAFIPKAQVTAVELSSEAFEYLEKNSNKKIQTVKADVLSYYEKLPENGISLIISNPPYISLKDMSTLQPELSFEPTMALTDEKDGLIFYREIAKNYYKCVAKGGWLVFEIGHTQAQQVTEICKASGWKNIEIQNDIENRPRVLIAEKQ